MYNLQKYMGIASRYTCPSCGRKRCFTRYVDESNEPLHETVGRCDHESSCGYHYTPKQFYADHPDLKPGKDWRDDRPAWLDKPQPAPTCFLPRDIVSRSVRYDYDSSLVAFLRTLLDPAVVDNLIDVYRLGVTRARDIIYFQIDTLGRCRTGKVMKYDPDTGHRIKDENTSNRITWIHTLMKRAGQLPADWTLSQCLFGEHLLPAHPDQTVALVESEKTALICAGLMPKYLWLATGGKSCLNDRILALKGRKVIAFPDIDGFQDWTEKLAKYPQLCITVSSLLQQNATPEDLAAHIDIADWLIRYRLCPPGEPVKQHCAVFLKAAKFISPKYHEELEALIDELDLDFWGSERVNEGTFA